MLVGKTLKGEKNAGESFECRSVDRRHVIDHVRASGIGRPDIPQRGLELSLALYHYWNRRPVLRGYVLRRQAGRRFCHSGSIVGGIGLVLLYQNIAQRWESMSYFWTFIIFFVGAGIYIMGWYDGDAGQKKSGSSVMKLGLVLFVLFGAFFEMIFSSFDNLLFPILLILLGSYMILSRTGLFGAKKDDISGSVPNESNPE
jgi:hypothetical protein